MLQLTISSTTQEKLHRAQALLSHQLPSGNLADVLDMALDALVTKLEKRKFAKTDRPRRRMRSTSRNPRHIPAHVRRAVWERDGGRCTFVGENGRRCNACKFLQYDHVIPVARGGRAAADNIRLRCRTHNQLEAERVFGAGFMQERREAAAVSGRRGTAAASARNGAAAAPGARAPDPHAPDVISCLRTLGVRAGEARRAAQLSADSPGGTLEERVRAALRFVGPAARRAGMPIPASDSMRAQPA